MSEKRKEKGRFFSINAIRMWLHIEAASRGYICVYCLKLPRMLSFAMVMEEDIVVEGKICLDGKNGERNLKRWARWIGFEPEKSCGSG